MIGDWRRIQDEEFRELYSLEKVNVKLAPEQTMKVQRGSRDITVLLDFGARVWWVVTATPRPLYHRERDPVQIVWDACCDRIKKIDMGGACGTYGEQHTGLWLGDLRERDDLKDLGIGGRTVLQWIFNK